MYFAVQAMAAEMSTGLFPVGQTYKTNSSSKYAGCRNRSKICKESYWFDCFLPAMMD
jgi:hypothetical protein